MSTTEFRPGVNLMANQKAIQLLSMANEDGDEIWWWVMLLFVTPKTELMAFRRNGTYQELHTKRAA